MKTIADSLNITLLLTVTSTADKLL